ncbi:hypothetical protein ACIBG8_20120 [Nonomuraea sp. NPDC050556]|uniref:hypothetical protein n=1 Tax=Nonomuraea sp. NPDC050556 TaxID=3364369 RepID=UPI0037A51FFA
MIPYALALNALLVVTVALAAFYLSRFTMARPPVGKFVGADIAVMVVVLVAMPFVYLNIPVPLVVTIFGLMMFTVVQLTLAPVIGGRAAAVTAVAVCAADIGAYFLGWDLALLVLNDLVLVTLVVGAVNMWVQVAMTPAQVAALAAALTVYDTLATGLTSLTSDFVARLDGLPFAPMMATRYGQDPSFTGLGDCLMLALWPLVALRAYGRRAAWWAAGLAGALIVISTGFVLAGGGPVPLLSILGPLIVAQWLFWRRWKAARTHAPVRFEVDQSLTAVPATVPGAWVALSQGVPVAEGATPGQARRAYRQAGLDGTPVVIRVVE